MEQRLLGFLQNECGHQHPLLRHLAKVLHNDNDAATGAFRAVGIPLVAAEHLGLPTDEGGHLLGTSDVAEIQRG